MRTSSSFPSSFAPDRGPAKYFHGRRQILSDFGEILRYSKQNKWGTTFLIQGAPGAGKTALLAKCGELARDRGWKISDIDPPALWNPSELRQSLGLKIKIEGGSAHVGIPGIGEAEVSAGRFPHTMKTLLQKGRDPLLLTLDEAQTLGKNDVLPPDQAHTASSVLNAIHNGKLNKPVLLLAAGLGTTTESFRSFGISRFEGNALMELGALGKGAERAILHDWLTEDGGTEGDTTVWIDSVTQETHGWPQHILSYVKPALNQLHATKGEMTAEGLNAVLEAGRAGRDAYYKQRAQGFYRKQLHCIARSIVDVPAGSRVDHAVIISSLLQDYGHNEAEKIFRRALHKGILDERDNSFVVPIPSMHDWLVSNYARIQEKEMPSRSIGQSQGQRSSARASL